MKNIREIRTGKIIVLNEDIDSIDSVSGKVVILFATSKKFENMKFSIKGRKKAFTTINRRIVFEYGSAFENACAFGALMKCFRSMK